MRICNARATSKYNIYIRFLHYVCPTPTAAAAPMVYCVVDSTRSLHIAARTGRILLVLARNNLSQPDHAVAVHESNMGAALAILEGIANQGLLRLFDLSECSAFKISLPYLYHYTKTCVHMLLNNKLNAL